MTNLSERDLPTPTFKVVKTLVDDPVDDKGDYRTLLHVKLGKTHVARLNGTAKYVDVDYVRIGIVRLTKSDDRGTFVYEETAVVASDEDAKEYEAYIYLAQRALSIEEIMFSIGEM